jgi:hypothetical protein
MSLSHNEAREAAHIQKPAVPYGVRRKKRYNGSSLRIAKQEVTIARPYKRLTT